MTQTPRLTGSGPDPKKWVLREIYLLPGFSSEGVVSYLFGICTTRQKNVGSRILIFYPGLEKTGPKGRAGRPGAKNFGILTFFIKGTPAQMGCGYFLILCNFVVRCTLRAAGDPAGGPGPKIKNWNFNFFYKSKVVVDPILRLFGYLQLFDRMHPQGPRALGKVRKRPWDYCLVNKMLDFGLNA